MFLAGRPSPGLVILLTVYIVILLGAARRRPVIGRCARLGRAHVSAATALGILVRRSLIRMMSRAASHNEVCEAV